MSDPFMGEIRIVGFNFAPRGWAFCNGQLMSLAQNTALFSLFGTTFGGNGTSTFALPNLEGRAPMQFGNGPGLTPRKLGESGGTPAVTLLESQIPSHNHPVHANGNAGDLQIPSPARALARTSPGFAWGTGAADATFAPQAIGVTGESQSHDNMQPFLVMNFVVALQGVFPSRP